jgi:osmotically-inducible protein OsmY
MNAETIDKRIREEIQLGLHWMPGVNSGHVGVAVEGGVVTITGHVADPSVRQAVEQFARRVPGVRSVANEVQVLPPANDAHLEVGLVRAVVDEFGRGHQPLH